jgi:hypothetical protein
MATYVVRRTKVLRVTESTCFSVDAVNLTSARHQSIDRPEGECLWLEDDRELLGSRTDVWLEGDGP